MKKILALAMALVMVFALTVSVAAQEVLFEHEILFPEDNGWWQDYSDLRSNEDLIAALKTEGAKLRIKADAAAADGFQYGFQDTNTWVNVLVHSNFANGEGVLGAELVVVDGDYAFITVDGAQFMACAEAEGAPLAGYNWINGAGSGKTYSIFVVIPDAAEVPAAVEPAEEAPVIVEPVEEAPAVEAAPAPAVSTTTAPAPAKTGVVMAVLPMAVAAAAVAFSKKR